MRARMGRGPQAAGSVVHTGSEIHEGKAPDREAERAARGEPWSGAGSGLDRRDRQAGGTDQTELGPRHCRRQWMGRSRVWSSRLRPDPRARAGTNFWRPQKAKSRGL